MGTQSHCSPDGSGCLGLTAHPDTKVVITPRTTLAHIRLRCTLFADDKQPCAHADWLHGVLEDNPHVPILQVPPHANVMDDVVQACNGKANPTMKKTQQRHVEREGTRLLFAANEPTTKKAGKDKCPFKHPHPNTLSNVVDSKPAMALPNYSLTSHSSYCWKLELVGLTTPVLMESEESVLSIPMCHALPLIGTSGPVKQVDIFRRGVQGCVAVGSDMAPVQGGGSGEEWRDAGEHEDRGGHRGPQAGQSLQRGMAKLKPASSSGG